jgi:glycerophosphoryl diester phosphodiesterase
MVQTFLIFGHRGSPARFPENTLASFDEALRAGADGFETDLRLLSDNTAVLYHDDEHHDDTIESLSSSELTGRGAIVQPLADLERYAARTTMVLEVKRSKWEDVLLQHIGTWPNIVIASFDHAVIADLHRRGVTSALGITTYGTILGLAAYAESLGCTWCFPAFRYVDAEMVASLHERGIKVVPWTVNRSRDWERLRALECDGVITDVPHEAVAWRDGQESNAERRTQN